MRVYHFLNEQYGLQAINDERLKIGRLAAFNDPFEYFHLDTDNYGTREVVKGRRKRANWDYGIICFSQNNSNPVQWAHYSDSHKGLCLGFDIPDVSLIEIDYISRRASENEFKEALEHKKENFVKYMLSKKYKHWEYEEEVFIGFRSSITKKELKRILRKNYSHVSVNTVSPSRKKYEMVSSGENA